MKRINDKKTRLNKKREKETKMTCQNGNSPQTYTYTEYKVCYWQYQFNLNLHKIHSLLLKTTRHEQLGQRGGEWIKTVNSACKCITLDSARHINTDIIAVCFNPSLTLCTKFGSPYVGKVTAATRAALPIPASVSSTVVCVCANNATAGTKAAGEGEKKKSSDQ